MYHSDSKENKNNTKMKNKNINENENGSNNKNKNLSYNQGSENNQNKGENGISGSGSKSENSVMVMSSEGDDRESDKKDDDEAQKNNLNYNNNINTDDSDDSKDDKKDGKKDPKKDLKMSVHHITTAILCIVSYYCGYAKIGSVIMFLHDVSDLPLDFLRIFSILEYSSLQLFSYVLLVLTWIYWRLWFFPTAVLYSIAVQSKSLIYKVTE